MPDMVHPWAEFRKKHLLTQAVLAELTGISRRAIQYIEMGKVEPKTETLSRFRALKLKYEREGRK